ncbi:OsmC family protein [Natronomonas salsuginis]|uniref:OsmC family protein n=1 Tax=Natronomonas salsuginis TaxID=2217661 RepID=A0A4U5JHA3_9EURY|nr:OsmC family protein [Natronomonas salsuginis]TKR27846.1 OsmC family protein [Natronomonas salsuginis]
MADIETTTVNEEKYHALSRAGEFELSIDATGGDGPTPNEVLVADYASCFSFACRAGANRRLDIDLGKIETSAEADLNDSDDLTGIRFHIYVEADLTDEEVDDVIELGEEICHIHDAVKESLHAEIELTPDAF